MHRICYLADASSSHTKKFCDYFIKQGYEIHVISLNKGTIEGVYTHNFDFNVKELKNDRSIKKLKYLKVIKEIKKIVKEINPDILHAHFASSYGLLGRLVNFKPYIISVWGTDIYEFPKKSFIHKLIIKQNLKKADEILSTSVAMSKETYLYTNKNIYITPFGVDIERFKPIDIDKDKDKIVIGTVKTLETKYGIDYLIKAFNRVKYRLPNKKMSLVIGGDGTIKQSLINLTEELGLQNEVSFIGQVESTQIVEIFNSFDIAVFPSLQESFGVAAVEAQACGIPVIATNIGGLPEATVESKSAILVESKNVEQLADAIYELVIDPYKRKEMGSYGREFVCEKYNVNDNFIGVNEIYKKYINKAKIKPSS